MASGPTTSWQTDGETMQTVRDFIFLGSKITADGDWSHEIKRRLLLGRKPMTNLNSILKSRDITLPTKVHLVKAMVFPVVMCGCESWTIKKDEHRRIDTFELWCWRTLQSPLDCKEIQPVNPKGNQSWLVIGAEAETPVLWSPNVKNWLTEKDPDAEKDWRQKEKGTTEDEMVGWQHQLNGHEFEQALRVGDGQRSLVCCSPWGHDWVSELNNKWYKWTLFKMYSHPNGLCENIKSPKMTAALQEWNTRQEKEKGPNSKWNNSRMFLTPSTPFYHAETSCWSCLHGLGWSSWHVLEACLPSVHPQIQTSAFPHSAWPAIAAIFGLQKHLSLKTCTSLA